MENIFENDVISDLLCEDLRRPRIINQRENFFDSLDEIEFRRRFRLSKRTTLSVLEMIEDKLEFPNDKNNSVAPILQLLGTLHFYATNFTYLTAGDYSGFSKSTALRVVHRVSSAIAELHPKFIKFPETDSEINLTKQEFYKVASFPNVVGALDCTHVRIKSPGGDNAEVFRNRKGYFSLNVQAICNTNLEFVDIVARWPGSCHDSTIFNNSYRNSQFYVGKYGNSVVLGDAGYACSSYLLTPVDKPTRRAEHLYNESHIRTRNVIERTFGVWKRRFLVLSLGLRTSLKNIYAIIVATAVLNNILRKAGESVPPDDPQLLLNWESLLAEGTINDSASCRGQFRRRQKFISYFDNL